LSRNGWIARPPLLIRSRESGLSVELIWVGPDHYTAHIRGFGLDASDTVWGHAAGGLTAFFGDIAASWKGWEGTKSWAPLESTLSMSARTDRGGHVFLDVTLASGAGDSWRVFAPLVLEAGQLQRIAADAAAFEGVHG